MSFLIVRTAVIIYFPSWIAVKYIITMTTTYSTRKYVPGCWPKAVMYALSLRAGLSVFQNVFEVQLGIDYKLLHQLFTSERTNFLTYPQPNIENNHRYSYCFRELFHLKEQLLGSNIWKQKLLLDRHPSLQFYNRQTCSAMIFNEINT